MFARLRRHLLGAPLFLPTAGVAGMLLFGWAGTLPALAAAAALRLWRVAVCTLLVSLAALLQLLATERGALALHENVARHGGELHCIGTVVRQTAHGYILEAEDFRARLSVTGDAAAEAGLGDRVEITALPAEETAPPFPGMFDAAAWRRSQGIAASYLLLKERKLGHPLSLASLRARGQEIRETLVQRLMPAGTEADSRRQVLCAMLLGAKEEADAETLDLFRRGGCLHIFAVSGLHVGLVAALLWGLFTRLGLRPAVVRPLSLLLVGAYVLVTGAAVPALRAYTMIAVPMGALILRRRMSLLNTWCMAALLALLCDPAQIGNAGFLLSFGIYAAICIGWSHCLRHDRPWFGPNDYIPFLLRNEREQWWQHAELVLRGAVIVSVCAWLAALPVTLYFFHSATPYSFLINLLAAPLLPLVMGAGMLHLAAAGVPYLSLLTEAAALKSTGWLVALISAFASLPGSYLPAALPQPQDALLVLPAGRNYCCCVLGNPGLVIEPGNASDAARTTAPALFHGGFRPAYLLPLRRNAAAQSGVNELLHRQTQLHALPADGGEKISFETKAGRYTLYPAAASLPAVPQTLRSPVIIWESTAGETQGARVMYLGSAARSTWESLPPEERRADVLILGSNEALPCIDPDARAAMGVKTLILLPDAAGIPLPPLEEIQVLHTDGGLLLRVNEKGGAAAAL